MTVSGVCDRHNAHGIFTEDGHFRHDNARLYGETCDSTVKPDLLPNTPKCPVCNEPSVSQVLECPYFEDSDHNNAAVSLV